MLKTAAYIPLQLPYPKGCRSPPVVCADTQVHQVHDEFSWKGCNSMETESRDRIVQLLETYHVRERKIALLHYELEHPAHISPNEMLNGMSFGHGEGSVQNPGYISDKTMYIALNYQEQAERLNASTKDEIAAQLIELEQEQNRLKYYVSLLDAREEEVIRLAYFSHYSWSEVSKKLGVTSRTARRTRDQAITKLARMYDFAGSAS